MKSLNNFIEESLLSDIDTTLQQGDKLMELPNRITSSNSNIRTYAFNDLYNEFMLSNTKQIKSKSKIKSSRKYFVCFYLSTANKIHKLRIFYRTGTDTYTDIYISINDKLGLLNNFYTLYRGMTWIQLADCIYLNQMYEHLFEVPEHLEPIIKNIVALVNNK